MMRYMTMSQLKDLYLTLIISFALRSWPEVMNIMLMCDMKIKWIDHSQVCHSMNSREQGRRLKMSTMSRISR